MRKALFVLLILTGSLAAQAQTSFKTAVEYNDYIINRQMLISGYINGLVAVATDSTTTPEKLNAKVTECTSATRTYIDEVKKMPAWKGNIAFRDAAAKLFEFYYTSFNGELKDIAEILIKADISDDDYAQVKVLQQQITDKEGPLDEAFLGAQKKFASDNNFTLTTGEE